MNELEQRVAALEARLLRVEDELAIHKLVVTYGFAVDTGDADWTSELFTTEALFDIDAMEMRGPREIHEMVLGERHQSLLPNCAHTVGPITVDIDGDRAHARGYSRLYLRNEDGIDLWRLSLNRWELVRQSGTWKIARRTTRLLGNDEALELLQRD